MRFAIVTPNPAIDITYEVSRQAIGETLRVQTVYKRAGGKGNNVACILNARGHEVVAVEPLGGNSGRWIGSQLRADGIRVCLVSVQGETRSTVTVVDGVTHPTSYSEPGPEISDDEWERLADVTRSAAESADWVLIAGSFPKGAHPDRARQLVQGARCSGAKVMVDTSGEFLKVAAGAGAHVVKGNESEVLEAAGQTDARLAMKELSGSTSLVFMSRGIRGAWLRLPDGSFLEQPVSVVEGNPTGAGDAATAGFLDALARDADYRTALEWASACGSAAVASPVAGSVDLAALELASGNPLPPAPESSPN